MSILEFLNKAFSDISDVKCKDCNEKCTNKTIDIDDDSIKELIDTIEQMKANKKEIDSYKDNSLAKILIDMFNVDEVMEKVEDLEEAIKEYQANKKENKTSKIIEIEDVPATVTRVERDKSVTEENVKVNHCAECEEEYCDNCEFFEDVDNELTQKVKHMERPSEKISTELGLQVHKLVQEYIDTMIKPYNPKQGGLTTQQINDAYAGLYEFACWILNK